jgi:hypothetical protein
VVSSGAPEWGEPADFVVEGNCQSKKPKLVAFHVRGPRPQFLAVVKPKSQN